MIPNCDGCIEEICHAYMWQQEGYHLATTDKYPNSYPVGRHHFCLIMVNDDGKIVVS